MSNQQEKFFISYFDGVSSIYGHGASAELAIEEAKQWAEDGDVSEIKTIECTKALHDLVDEYGGDIEWVIVDGAAMTYEEAEQV